MPRIDESRGFAVIPIRAFDDDPGVRPERHIYVDSKASCGEITDGLPTFSGPPPSPCSSQAAPWPPERGATPRRLFGEHVLLVHRTEREVAELQCGERALAGDSMNNS
jgi:hypothetical protein